MFWHSMKMKNKKAEQQAAKQKHREQLRAQRRREPDLNRIAPERTEKPLILIVCEGENTEPSYFNQFRLSTARIKSVGEGYNTVSLVNRALVLSQKDKYDQVWCVFDKDDFSAKDFNQAIQIAEANDFGVAYSNQAFEYWLILHLDDHQGAAMPRQDYHQRINELLAPYGLSYDGQNTKLVKEELFEFLNGYDERTNRKRVELAISRAERNYSNSNQGNPAKEESSTTVFRLLKELLKHL